MSIKISLVEKTTFQSASIDPVISLGYFTEQYILGKPDVIKKTKQPDFEQSLTELESIVNNMEKGDMSLEASLKAFENGIKLTQSCQASLKKAEQKVEILMKNSGSKNFKPFDEDEDSE